MTVADESAFDQWFKDNPRPCNGNRKVDSKQARDIVIIRLNGGTYKECAKIANVNATNAEQWFKRLPDYLKGITP